MKAHIARNQNAGVPLALGWNLSNADRGKLEGMAPAFGMKLLLVSPADAGKTVAQLLGEVETRTARTLVLEPGAYPPALGGCHALQLAPVGGGKVPAQRQRHPGVLVACNVCFHL